MKIKIKDGIINIDSGDLLWEVAESFETDFEKEEFIERLGWDKLILNRAVDIIVNEFSGSCVNPHIHKKREEILKKIKEGVELMKIGYRRAHEI